MKKLTKILLINWLYYRKQVIELGDINFLTGKTGAGKSTVIDALQIVLLGELNARNFNKAANESSQRTLDGYLRADIDGHGENSRRGKDFSSYIACEFFDDTEGSSFTLGVVFDCRADGSLQERFFSYSGILPEHCFIISRIPMDIPALRAWLNAEYKAYSRIYDSQKEYRADVLAKWNVHTEQVFRMLKKAVSFRPIVDIQQFITENICDAADLPDIRAMQQNIREYKRHEEIAQRQEEQVVKLREIGDAWRELQRASDRYEEHVFLSLWAQKENLEEKSREAGLEQQAYHNQLSVLSDENAAAEAVIQAKDAQKNTLAAECARSEVFQTETRLKSERQSLLTEQAKLAAALENTALHIRREAQFISALCGTISGWPEDPATRELKRCAADTANAFSALEGCDAAVFSQPEHIFSQAAEISGLFSRALRDAAYTLGISVQELRRRLSEKEAVLSRLRNNVKDYPEDLLTLRKQLAEELSTQCRRAVTVDILADVLEIADGQDAWRGAVEGYLNTQKFYLLVDPSVYEKALNIFDQTKKQFPHQSFGLVDVGKLRERERIQAWDDSLAKKVVTENALARDYIDFLLGRVVCCTHVSQLRRYKTAITQEGMLYQGYVARPLRRTQMEDAFIGRKAVEIRMEKLESDICALRGELDRLEPVYRTADEKKDHEFIFSTLFLEQVSRHRREHLRGLEINAELDRVEDDLSHLDLFWLEKKRAEIDGLQGEIDRLRSEIGERTLEIGRLKEKLRTLEEETLPNLLQESSVLADRIADRFTGQYVETTGLPRYMQELKRLRSAAVIAKNFGGHLAQTEGEQRSAKEKLLRSRAAYVQAFQPCSYDVDAALNDEFDNELRLLEESELPKYREKIRQARESALEQFQNDFLYRLQSSIKQVQDQVRNLNKALKYAQFGTEQYQFRADRNPDYAEYYDMIMAPELMDGESGLFTWAFQEKYSSLIEDLFSRLATSDDTQLNARKQSELQQNIERYTDFRTYLQFDLETTDRYGNKQLLSQTLNKKSGGETQTPFYIAVLASFAQLYQVNNHSPGISNTVRLVIFDEAFNKMDSDRIVESVRLLRSMHLQAVICTPPDKIADIMPLADKTLLVHKDRSSMHVLPWSKELSQ